MERSEFTSPKSTKLHGASWNLPLIAAGPPKLRFVPYNLTYNWTIYRNESWRTSVNGSDLGSERASEWIVGTVSTEASEILLRPRDIVRFSLFGGQ